MKQKVFRTLICGLIGLTLGSLFANIYCCDDVGEWGVFSYSFLEKMQSITIDDKKLFSYVFIERVKVWIIMGLLSATGIGFVLKHIYIIMLGFVAGITCSMAVMEYGIVGTLYYLVLTFVAQIILLWAMVMVMEEGQLLKKRDRLRLVIITISLALLMLSSLVETYFNINFVRFLK